MVDFTIDPNLPILFDFATPTGRTMVVSRGVEDLAGKSAHAVTTALSTIHNMATGVTEAISKLATPPSTVEVEFGIKFDTETGAIIAKAGVEASLTIKLIWERKDA